MHQKKLPQGFMLRISTWRVMRFLNCPSFSAAASMESLESLDCPSSSLLQLMDGEKEIASLDACVCVYTHTSRCIGRRDCMYVCVYVGVCVCVYPPWVRASMVSLQPP